MGHLRPVTLSFPCKLLFLFFILVVLEMELWANSHQAWVFSRSQKEPAQLGCVNGEGTVFS